MMKTTAFPKNPDDCNVDNDEKPRQCPVQGLNLNHGGRLFKYHQVREWKLNVDLLDMRALRVRLCNFLKENDLKQVDMCSALGLAQTYMSFFVRDACSANLGPRKRLEFYNVLTEFFRLVDEDAFDMKGLLTLRDERALMRESARVNRRPWGELSGRRVLGRDYFSDASPGGPGGDSFWGDVGLRGEEAAFPEVPMSQDTFRSMLLQGPSNIPLMKNLFWKHQSLNFELLEEPTLRPDGHARPPFDFITMDPLSGQLRCTGRKLDANEQYAMTMSQQKAEKRIQDFWPPLFGYMSDPEKWDESLGNGQYLRNFLLPVCVPLGRDWSPSMNPTSRKIGEKIKWQGGLFSEATAKLLTSSSRLPPLLVDDEDAAEATIPEENGPHEWVIWNAADCGHMVDVFVRQRLGRELGHSDYQILKVIRRVKLQLETARIVMSCFMAAVEVVKERLLDEDFEKRFPDRATPAAANSSNQNAAAETPDAGSGEQPPASQGCPGSGSSEKLDSEQKSQPVLPKPPSSLRVVREDVGLDGMLPPHLEQKLRLYCCRIIRLDCTFEELGLRLTDEFKWDIRQSETALKEFLSAVVSDMGLPSSCVESVLVAAGRQVQMLRREFAIQVHRALCPEGLKKWYAAIQEQQTEHQQVLTRLQRTLRERTKPVNYKEVRSSESSENEAPNKDDGHKDNDVHHGNAQPSTSPSRQSSGGNGIQAQTKDKPAGSPPSPPVRQRSSSPMTENSEGGKVTEPYWGNSGESRRRRALLEARRVKREKLVATRNEGSQGDESAHEGKSDENSSDTDGDPHRRSVQASPIKDRRLRNSAMVPTPEHWRRQLRANLPIRLSDPADPVPKLQLEVVDFRTESSKSKSRRDQSPAGFDNSLQDGALRRSCRLTTNPVSYLEFL